MYEWWIWGEERKNKPSIGINLLFAKSTKGVAILNVLIRGRIANNNTYALGKDLEQKITIVILLHHPSYPQGEIFLFKIPTLPLDR